MMLHHISFAVRDLALAGVFYDALLEPLGYVRVDVTESFIGYGPPGEGDKFALKLRRDTAEPPQYGFHLAFAAPSRLAVDEAFHAALRTGGGRDNGPPGLRLAYGNNYYAAFLVDPDGYHVEVVINR